MTLGDARASMKKTITQLFSFKTTLRSSFFPERNGKERLSYPFSLTWGQHRDGACSLRRAMCKSHCIYGSSVPRAWKQADTRGTFIFPSDANWMSRQRYQLLIVWNMSPECLLLSILLHWPPPQQDKFFWPTKPIFSYYFFLSLFISPHGNIPVAAARKLAIWTCFSLRSLFFPCLSLLIRLVRKFSTESLQALGSAQPG